jgi:hypothetical protein
MMKNKTLIFLFLLSICQQISANQSCLEEQQKRDVVVFDGIDPCLEDPAYRSELERNALKGDAEAATSLAQFYWAKDNDKDASFWLKWASQVGESEYRVSYVYWLEGRIKTTEDALYAYEQAVGAFALGNTKGAYLAGSIAKTNLKQRETARAWYLIAANSGHRLSIANLVKLANEKQASEWERACAAAWSSLLSETYPKSSYNYEHYRKLSLLLSDSLSPEVKGYAKKLQSNLKQRFSGKLHE